MDEATYFRAEGVPDPDAWEYVKVRIPTRGTFRDLVEALEKKEGRVETVGYAGRMVYADFLHGEDEEFMETEAVEVLRRAVEEDDLDAGGGEDEEKELERDDRDLEDDRAALTRLKERWFEVEAVVDGDRRIERVRVIKRQKSKRERERKREKKKKKKG